MEASKAGDFYGFIEGHSSETADAEQAYTQSLLGGTETWVKLPKERWPKEWVGKYRDPVVRLRLALYGHPDSGGFWEQKCDTHLQSVGFEPIVDWRSCYFHKKWQLFLVVYVDDFKLSGPQANLAKGWKVIREGINMGDPEPLGKFLGCDHEVGSAKLVNGELHPCAAGDRLPGSHRTM